MNTEATYTVFAGSERITAGPAAQVALELRRLAERPDGRALLAFEDVTGRQIDFDLQGSEDEVASRYAPARRSPGRPKLGVVGREVTLLPRHWEWLNAQPGGASVALRKLVEVARRDNAEADAVRASQDAAFGFMTALAGNEPGFEEATRALYAADAERFDALAAEWPADVAAYARRLSDVAFCRGA